MKNYAVGIASACLVAGLTAFTALDTFVFADVYQVDAVAQDTSGAFASAQSKLSSGSDADVTATDAKETDATQTDTTTRKISSLTKRSHGPHGTGTSSQTKSKKSSSSSQGTST
ncbi:MAG: hypothetical protein Q4B54_13310, partial [Coriobacteriales bacterium]|nr:hypothetical protein [Coriobacteriales bacterium]